MPATCTAHLIFFGLIKYLTKSTNYVTSYYIISHERSYYFLRLISMSFHQIFFLNAYNPFSSYTRSDNKVRELSAYRDSSGQKIQCGLIALAYQPYTALLLLIYGSLFLSGVYYCLSVFWCPASRQCTFSHGTFCEGVFS
jgi:hypothetical protein